MTRLLESFLGSRPRDSRVRTHRPLRLERLEERRLLSLTFEVRNGSDHDAYSLREAIGLSNATGGHDTIIIKDATHQFNDILLDRALPQITDGVTIYTESGTMVYIHCEDNDPILGEWGLYVNITAPGNSHSISFTDLEVANADGDAFRLGGDTLVSATLTNCCAWGTMGDYNDGAGILIASCNATSITLTDCDILHRKTGIALAASAHVTTLTIEGAQISASYCEPSTANWVGIKCEGTGNVLIQDHIEIIDEVPVVVEESCIYDIPGTAIYLNGHGTTDLQVEITGTEIGISPWNAPGPITGNGVVVDNWRGTFDQDGLHISCLVGNTVAYCEFREKPCRTWRVGEVSQAA